VTYHGSPVKIRTNQSRLPGIPYDSPRGFSRLLVDRGGQGRLDRGARHLLAGRVYGGMLDYMVMGRPGLGFVLHSINVP